jgi:RNA polymerase sigma-70 factor, ECF subfamily
VGTENVNRDHELRRLVERFYRPVARFFVNRGFNHEESRDLTQETFIGVMRGIDGFRGEASEETWVFRIAANTWRNALRSRSAGKRHAPETSLDELLEIGWTPSERGPGDAHPALSNVLQKEQIEALRQAMEELPTQMRCCVFLRVTQDMKYREIAAAMQISIETVKSQLFQAKERLKLRLEGHFEDLY